MSLFLTAIKLPVPVSIEISHMPPPVCKSGSCEVVLYIPFLPNYLGLWWCWAVSPCKYCWLSICHLHIAEELLISTAYPLSPWLILHEMWLGSSYILVVAHSSSIRAWFLFLCPATQRQTVIEPAHLLGCRKMHSSSLENENHFLSPGTMVNKV